MQRERKQCDRMREWKTKRESGRVIDWEGERATEWKWKSWEYAGFQKFGIPHLLLQIFTSTFAHATSDTLTQLPRCQVGVMNQRCQQNIIPENIMRGEQMLKCLWFCKMERFVILMGTYILLWYTYKTATFTK